MIVTDQVSFVLLGILGTTALAYLDFLRLSCRPFHPDLTGSSLLPSRTSPWKAVNLWDGSSCADLPHSPDIAAGYARRSFELCQLIISENLTTVKDGKHLPSVDCCKGENKRENCGKSEHGVS